MDRYRESRAKSTSTCRRKPKLQTRLRLGSQTAALTLSLRSGYRLHVLPANWFASKVEPSIPLRDAELLAIRGVSLSSLHCGAAARKQLCLFSRNKDVFASQSFKQS